jgi:hypothetical protein
MSTLRMIGMLVVCAGLGYAVWLDNTSGESDDAPERVNHAKDDKGALQPTAPADVTRPAGARTGDGGPTDAAPIPSGENQEAAATPAAPSEAPASDGQSANADDGSTGVATVDGAPDENQVANPLSNVDIGMLSDTVERPLFAVSRQRPPPKPDSAEPGDKAPATFELLGVVVNGARATAILRRKQTGANFSVETGDTLSGWKVARIEPSSVVLEGPEGVVETIKILRN